MRHKQTHWWHWECPDEMPNDDYASVPGLVTCETCAKKMRTENGRPAKKKKSGSRRRRDDRPRTTEHAEQAAVIQWASMNLGRFPELWGLHSIPNGANMGDNDLQRAYNSNRQRAEGMKKGVCDLFLPVARRGFHGLYLEMKRDGDSRTSPDQDKFIAFVNAQGFYADRFDGAAEAIAFLEWYLSNNQEPMP